MRKSRYTDSQIMAILKQNEQGASVADLCREHGMSLRNVKCFAWNHKRVYRIYRELELNLRIKPRRRLKREKPETLGTDPMYLRISELVADERSTPTMGDFRKDRDGNWWFHVTGKGNKDRIVTVSDDMLRALKRYRKHLGTPPLPAPNDPQPVIVNLVAR